MLTLAPFTKSSHPIQAIQTLEIPNNAPLVVSPTSTNSQAKKKRKRTSPQQLEVLENTFGTTHHPNLAHRNQLATQLGMPLRSVQIWFQNRRAKERNKEYKHSKINPKKMSEATLLTSIPEIIQEKNLLSGQMNAIDNPSVGTEGENKSALGTPQENIAMVLEQLGNLANEVDLSNPSNLISLKGEITARLSEQGLSLIFTSTVLGGETQLEELLESSAVDVNIVDCEENTPLMVAAALGHIKVVEQLLAHGANPNKVNKYGCTALYAALANGHDNIAIKLIQLGAEVNTKDREHGEYPIHVAALQGFDDVVAAMLKDPNTNIHVEDSEGRTPLHHACATGHTGVVRMLLKQGSNPNAQDKGGHTPLQAAALHENMETVICMIEEGRTDVNIQDQYGNTALHYAVKKESEEMTKYLVEHGAKGLKNRSNVTPLLLALQKEAEPLCIALVDRMTPEDINVQDEQGKSALHLACTLEMVPLVERMLEKADSKLRDFEGQTPLHVAATTGELKIVKLLTRKGTDGIFSLDKLGKSPLTIAESLGYKKMAEYLRKKEASREEEGEDTLIIDEGLTEGSEVSFESSF